MEDVEKRENEQIEIDWKEKLKKINKFASKYSMLLVLILVLALQFIPNSEGQYPWGGMYMRGLVEEMPQTEQWSRTNVDAYYKTQLKTAIDKEYPNLPEKNKQEVLEDKFKDFKEQNKNQIEEQVKVTRQQLLDHFQYEHEGEKYLYMPDIDPYFYLRKARNFIETGDACDTTKEGQPWDNHMIAPHGVPCGGNSHAYILTGIYKINKIFNNKIDLTQAAAKFSIIFIFLSIILAYFIGLKIGGKTTGFFSALMIGILPAILSRTPWGHADTDAYNIFFPLLSLFTLFMALDAKKTRDRIIWGIITGFVFLVYSYFWEFWFIFDAILAGLGIWAIIELIKTFKNKKYKNFFIKISPAISLFLSTAILIILFKSWTQFITFITGPLGRTAIKTAAHKSLWPNVFTTVAELNTGSMSNIISSVGGNLLFWIAIIGVFLALIIKDKKGERNIKLAAILTVWFLISIYASLKGVRFTLLLGPAFAIAFGTGAGLITLKVSEFANKNLGINKKLATILLIGIFGVIIATSGISKESYKMATHDTPIVNDAWYNSLTYIKDNSQKDAIINSWWDYGHHFKYFADRAVTFDGASQNSPMAHWIGRVLATKDEDEAIGILRMLDCGSNTAFEKINEKINDPAKSVALLYKIIKINETSAKEELNLNGLDADEIIKYTHCQPPENFFITSGDMIGKAGVWSHFGLWDFMKADMWINMKNYDKNKFVETLVTKYNLSETDAENYFNEIQSITTEEEANKWISPWPGYPSQWASCTKNEENMIVCGGMTINPETKEVTIQTQQGTAIPKTLVYMNSDKELKEFEQKNSNAEISALLIPTVERTYKAMLLSPELSTSIFTRLYYLEGHGLKHFKKVYQDRELTQGDIYVWKVDWEGGEKNMMESIKPKTEVKKGDRVAINYIGWLDDGEIFDSSIINWQNNSITKDSSFEGKKTKALVTEAGIGQLIKGFDNALLGMKKGEEKVIEIPPKDAYGTNESLHFLANKTLHFKIKVEEIV